MNFRHDFFSKKEIILLKYKYVQKSEQSKNNDWHCLIHPIVTKLIK